MIGKTGGAAAMLTAMDAHVGRFFAELDRAQDCAALEGALGALLFTLGFANFAYTISDIGTMVRCGGCPEFAISNLPPEWKHRYSQERYDKDDPMLLAAMERRVPVRWRDVLRPDSFTPRQRLLWALARGHGLCDGIMVPLETDFGEFAAISAFSRVPLDGPADADDRITHLLRMAGQSYHAKARRILLRESLSRQTLRRRCLLAPRELDALYWASRGKTAWETANILGISQKSVDFYMDSARVKLDAINRTHAVTKAVILGLIPALGESGDWASGAIRVRSQGDRGNCGDGTAGATDLPSAPAPAPPRHHPG